MSYFFDHPEFVKTWTKYTDYLLSEYDIVLNEDSISERIDKLDALCVGDIKKACAIIELMILRGETGIFLPQDNEFAP